MIFKFFTFAFNLSVQQLYLQKKVTNYVTFFCAMFISLG